MLQSPLRCKKLVDRPELAQNRPLLWALLVPTMEKRTSLHGHWSSRTAFILAVTGSAVGLGNIWKFPYVAGENGGGAFVLVYLTCVVAIGLPIMMSEVLLGRRGRRNPITTMKVLGEEEAGKSWWQIVGWNGIIAGFLILSFYSVIGGWSLAYIERSIVGTFVKADATVVTETLDGLFASWPRMLFWHSLFMVMTIVVVAKGVQRGLERAVEVLMPALVILLIVLLFVSARLDTFQAGLAFMFEPNFSKLDGDTILVAMGQAFFSLSIGMGAVMAYGAYLPEGTSIGSTSLIVVFADTAIAMLAGVVIFPIVFNFGLDPAEGPGLVFHSLPLALGQLPWSVVLSTAFFVLLTFGAWTSSIGLIEPTVAWLVERHQLSRPTAAWLVGGAIWCIGLGTVLSFNVLSDFQFFKGTIFDNLDYLASNVLLPMGGLLIAIFAGWVMCRNSSAEELDLGTGLRYKIWRFLTRFIAPVGVALVLLNASGLLAAIRG